MPNHPGRENDDVLLVAAVVRGDSNAFRTLIHQYEKLVISIVFKMISRKEDSEDICQDVFLKVFEKLPGFLFQSKLSTWIGSIAFNTCVNFLQKRKPMLLNDLSESGQDDDDLTVASEISIKDTGTGPDEKMVNKERTALLLAGIERLSVIQKTVLQLFHQQELSLQEISELTGLQVSTVKSHLFRARKQLKSEMGNY